MGIFPADLSRYTGDWVEKITGATAVIHLAGASWPYSNWPSLQSGNIDALLNVLEASLAGGIPRFIFASSLLTMEGYKHTGGMIHPHMPARPLSSYAVCKLAGERMCYSYSARHGLDVACLRLGITRRGENPPTNRVGLWEQSRWLGNDDVCSAMELALRKPPRHDPYTVFVVSNNAGMRWSLDEARNQLGYIPQESSTPSPPPLYTRVRAYAAAAKQQIMSPKRANRQD
jgi:uronate dehydrogenase